MLTKLIVSSIALLTISLSGNSAMAASRVESDAAKCDRDDVVLANADGTVTCVEDAQASKPRTERSPELGKFANAVLPFNPDPNDPPTRTGGSGTRRDA